MLHLFRHLPHLNRIRAQIQEPEVDEDGTLVQQLSQQPHLQYLELWVSPGPYEPIGFESGDEDDSDQNDEAGFEEALSSNGLKPSTPKFTKCRGLETNMFALKVLRLMNFLLEMSSLERLTIADAFDEWNETYPLAYKDSNWKPRDADFFISTLAHCPSLRQIETSLSSVSHSELLPRHLTKIAQGCRNLRVLSITSKNKSAKYPEVQKSFFLSQQSWDVWISWM